MVDAPRLRSLLARYREYRGYLEELGKRSNDALRSDFAVMGGVRHYLLLAIETLLDLGSHVISSEGFEPPKNYADIYRVLRDESIITAELADDLMAMARFRNVLVHLYADVDEERVLFILRSSVTDMDEFVDSILRSFGNELPGKGE
jgi:uncharacterized protein YutE (UPF0331/DUF86 family)